MGSIMRQERRRKGEVQDIVLKVLYEGPKGFNELHRYIENTSRRKISDKVLSYNLNRLEEVGKIQKEGGKRGKWMLAEMARKELQIQYFVDSLGQELGIMSGAYLSESLRKIGDGSFRELLLVLGAGIVYVLAEMRKRTAMPKKEEEEMATNLPLRIRSTVKIHPKNWYKNFVGIDGKPIKFKKPKEYIGFSSDPNKKAKQLAALEKLERYQDLMRMYNESLKRGFDELVDHLCYSWPIRDEPEKVQARMSRIKISIPRRARKSLTKYYVGYGVDPSHAREIVDRAYRGVCKSTDLREFLEALMKVPRSISESA